MQLEHFFRMAVELSLGGVAISSLRLLERADYGYLSSQRRMAEQDGLALQLTYRGFNADHLQDVIRVAGALGAVLLVFELDFERPPVEESFLARLDEMYEMVVAAMPVAERYSVGIALSGGGRLTADEMLELHRTSDNPRLGLCLDPLAALFVLEDPQTWAEHFGSRISCLTLCDYQAVGAKDGVKLFGCLPGEGILESEALLQSVQQLSPNAHIAIATPAEKLDFPFLHEDFLQRLHYTPLPQLSRMVHLMRKHTHDRTPILPQDSELSEYEILNAEEERFEQSLEWAKKITN